jgi:hypothetical protein
MVGLTLSQSDQYLVLTQAFKSTVRTGDVRKIRESIATLEAFFDQLIVVPDQEREDDSPYAWH